MQQQAKIDDVSGFSPSFSCYSSDSSTSAAVSKVIREEQASRFQEFGDFNGDDFEFSLLISDEDDSTEENGRRDSTAFPFFNGGVPVTGEKFHEAKAKKDQIDLSTSISGPLQKLLIDEREESSSYSSSEVDELESPHSKTYCVWRPKADGGSSSPSITKCKKSSSTGSGSKRWSIRYLLRRSNSEGKEPVALSTPKKVDNQKQRRNSGEVSKVAGRLKVQTPVHEQFYVQRRVEKEISKRKSYLPYRQDLVGLFSNVNGMSKMLVF